MRFAFIIDDYMPDSTRVGAKMFHELALEFLKNGHEVVVIRPDSNQSEKLVKKLYEGVFVWSFRSPPLKDISKINRAINESYLSFNAWRSIKSEVLSTCFDGIILYSPSIFFGSLVGRIKKVWGCQSYLVLRDLFPQWAIDSGFIKKGSVIEHYFRFFEKINYHNADYIGLMSDNNIDFFNKCEPEFISKTQLLRNWASLPSTDESNNYSYRSKLGLQKKVIYFYGGNIGHAQDMTNLMRLVRNMKMIKDAHFLFVGQGDEVALIQQLAIDWKLDEFSLLPSVSQLEFKQILSEIDVGLFSLAATHNTHNFPGKLLGYMVESKPILGSVNYGNDLLQIINNSNSGYTYYNGDDDALFGAAKKLFFDEKLRRDLGRNAFYLLEKEFSVESAYKNIFSSLIKIK